MIEVQDVSKDYDGVPAVEGVSFRIGPGEIVGFLGPNGAGKSTLLKLLCTYLEPSTGHLAVQGFDTRRRPLEVRRRIGYLPEHNALFETMRVAAFLRFVGRARGLRGEVLRQRQAWVVERCALAPVLDKRISACSKGFRQRIGLAAALIHDPPVLILDEPTHGLDPVQVVAFRDFLRELASGRAILFSSHILAEVVEISTRLLVIQGGRLCLDEGVESLRARAAAETASVEQLVLRAVAEARAARPAEAAR